MAKLIGIAGGSGAGKSTVCFGLWDKHPKEVGVFHLDDYFKPKEEVPVLNGRLNFEDPASIDFERFRKDLESLKKGQSVKVYTKSERLNPHFETKGKILVEIEAKPIMLVEGYLLFYDEQVRNLFDIKIYLDIPHEARYARRVHFKDREYEEQFLIPMHKKYVEPTKTFAEHIINVSKLSKKEVLSDVEKIIFSH